LGLVSIDGNLLRKRIICGANELTRGSKAVDALNVFPVPDGDTGTNMSHTVQAAAREVHKLNTPNIHDVAKAASGGALRGARGNSGVILSQLFRGFAKGLEGKTTADVEDLAGALAQGADTAYKAVMKPKEGTMLTIARVIGEQAYEAAYNEEDIETALKSVLRHANETLIKTQGMLPELKQAGVVDAGGMGLILILKGAQAALALLAGTDVAPEETPSASGEALMPAGITDADIHFAYCTEFLIDLANDAHSAQTDTGGADEVLRLFLPTIGDSIVVVRDESVVKIHVHTNNPGKALEKALQFGMLSNIKIENMRLQHTSLLEFSASSKPAKPIGFVAVAAGGGLCELFAGLGVDRVIEGGQTMNPSTETIVKAIADVNAENVIILPNNKNIILTAKQAAEINETGKSVHVVPTRSIPQGVACMVNYIDAVSVEDNLKDMNEAIIKVHSGQITQAVRDTVLDGVSILEGDFLCLYDGDILFTRKETQEAARSLLEHMLSFGGDVVSVYYGEDVTSEQAGEIGDFVQERCPGIEVEVYNGKQPLYSYILSVE
jgi:DAK2 domain fusion protein YloV